MTIIGGPGNGTLDLRTPRERKAIELVDQWEGEAMDPERSAHERMTLLRCARELRHSLIIDFSPVEFECFECHFKTAGYLEFADHIATHLKKKEG